MQPWSLLSRLIADAKRERVAFAEVLITLSVINEPHSYMLDDTGHDLKSSNSSSALLENGHIRRTGVLWQIVGSDDQWTHALHHHGVEG